MKSLCKLLRPLRALIREADIPEEVLEHEREIAVPAREEGKPEAMLDRIAEGRLVKFKDESVLPASPISATRP